MGLLYHCYSLDELICEVHSQLNITGASWVISNTVLVSVLCAVGELVGLYCWLTWFVSGLSPRRPVSVLDQFM